MLSYASAIVSYSGARLKGTVIFLHRWMGVPCCLLFVLWFASGIGMMYWQYPMVSEADRLNHAAVLDGSKIQLSPADAYARFAADAPPPTQARLEIFDNRPAYKFGERAEQVIVYADNGQVQTEFPAGMTGRIAAAWIGQPASTAKEQEDVPARPVDGLWGIPEIKSTAKVHLGGWSGGLRFNRDRRGRAVHHSPGADRRLSWPHPALAVLHAAPETRAAMEHAGDLDVGARNDRSVAGARSGPFDVFAFEAL